MAKFCTNCGHKIDEFADICTNCGKFIEKTNMKKNNKIGPAGISIIIIASTIILLLFAFIFLIALFDNYDEIEDANYYYDNDYNYTLEEDKIGTVGSILEYNDLNFKLNKATIYDYIEINNDKIFPTNGYEYLVFNFEVNNNSLYDYNLNIKNFIGYEDSTQANQKEFAIVDNDKLLNGIIKTNMSIKGNVIYEVKKGWQYFELEYNEKQSDNKITFKVSTPDKKNKNSVEF